MKLNDKLYDVNNNLETESSEFEIAANAKMFDILSNKIYEDPIRAIVRELSCNAIDANIEANNDEPFFVYLPTEMHKSLIIEDQGIGMTHEDVMTVYKSYGKSTKSNSDKVIGALGLGGKTPLAYTAQFTLATAKDGTLNNYIVYKDENGIPNVTLVNSQETDKTGTVVELIIKDEDIKFFHHAAIKTFLFFDKMPIIKRGENDFYNYVDKNFNSLYSRLSAEEAKEAYKVARAVLKKGAPLEDIIGNSIVRKVLESYNSTHGIIMGQVYYDVNYKQILGNYGNAASLCLNFPILGTQNLKKILHVDLGSVSIQPSRESLNYNKSTIEYLQKMFYAHYEDWAAEVKKQIVKPGDYVKKFNKIPHANLIASPAFDGADSTKVNFIRKIYTDAIEHTLKSLSIAAAPMYLIRTKKNTYEMANVHKYIGTKFTSTSRDFFENIMTKKEITTAIVIDELVFLDKLGSFHAKADAKGKSWTCIPVGMKNKLAIMKVESSKMLFIAPELVSVFKKFFPTMKFIYSSIAVPPKSATTSVRRERDTSLKCYDYYNRKYITAEAALEIAKNQPVTYECFEGDDPMHRGWWFTPKFIDIDNNPKLSKKESITIDYSGINRDNYCKIDKIDACLKDILNFSPRHFLVDFAFFKKNNLVSRKNWFYIDNYILHMLDNKQSIIMNHMLENNFHGKSFIANRTRAEYFLDIGKKYPGFKNTIFGQECQRKIAETAKPETDFFKIRDLTNAMRRLLVGLKPYSVYDTELSLKVFDTFDPIIKMAEDNRNNAQCHTRTDYMTPILAAYPMLQFAKDKSLDTEDIVNIVDYVAERDKL